MTPRAERDATVQPGWGRSGGTVVVVTTEAVVLDVEEVVEVEPRARVLATTAMSATAVRATALAARRPRTR